LNSCHLFNETVTQYRLNLKTKSIKNTLDSYIVHIIYLLLFQSLD